MNYWLVKADPDTDYSIDDLARDGRTEWTGVHNFQAIGHIKSMKPGDKVFVYHSQKEKQIVGLAEVAGEPYEDKNDPRTSWAVRLTFKKKFTHPVHLAAIKAEPSLADFLLVRNSRLSVMPVTKQVIMFLESRVSWAMEKKMSTIDEAKAFIKQFRALLAITLFVIAGGATFYHFVEGWRWIDSFYFSVISLAPVGYGDFTPKTDIGKVFTMFYLMIGIGIFAGLLNNLLKSRIAKRTLKVAGEQEQKK